MKNINIYFIHPMITSTSDITNYLKIPSCYNFIWNETNPDYVIASEWIYKDKRYYQKFISLQKNKPVNIFFAGEVMTPDLNLFDYAIVYDRNLSCDDRIIRLPIIDFFKKRLTQDFWKVCSNPKEELNKKTAFCNFIYTNSNAHPQRDKLFYKLSEYKKVDSLGTHLRNVNLNEKFVDEKIKRNYKFTIACENALYKGYTSEKLLTAMQAYTIPIYWGDPTVEEAFNPNRFINATNMNLDEVLDKVKKIDNNDALWCQIVSEPVMTKEQNMKYDNERQIYLNFWKHLFEQEPCMAKRIGEGTFPDIYRKFIISLLKEEDKLPVKDSLIQTIFSVRNKTINNKKYKVITILGIKIKIKKAETGMPVERERERVIPFNEYAQSYKIAA